MTTFASLSDEPMPSSPCPLAVDRELGAIRAQAAFVRSLLDELDDLAPPSSSTRFAEAFAAQAIEELAQLAHRMMQAAVSLSPQRVMELRLDLTQGSL